MWQTAVLCVCVLVWMPSCLAQQGQEQYSYDEYPNSLMDRENCGRDEENSRPIYVCDPNKILNEVDARQLDVLIETVMNETECRCAEGVCSQPGSPGYRISVSLLKKMKLPSVSSDGDAVMNQLQQVMSEASIFAKRKLSEFNLGRCADDIHVLYSMLDGVLYTVAGDEAGTRLQPSLVGEIAQQRRVELRQDAASGLRHLLSDYKAVLLGRYQPMSRQKSEPKYEAVRGGATTPTSLILATIITLTCTILSHVF